MGSKSGATISPGDPLHLLALANRADLSRPQPHQSHQKRNVMGLQGHSRTVRAGSGTQHSPPAVQPGERQALLSKAPTSNIRPDYQNSPVPPALSCRCPQPRVTIRCLEQQSHWADEGCGLRPWVQRRGVHFAPPALPSSLTAATPPYSISAGTAHTPKLEAVPDDLAEKPYARNGNEG
jgi:hypothetical protein